jgi:hypothetical protein
LLLVGCLDFATFSRKRNCITAKKPLRFSHVGGASTPICNRAFKAQNREFKMTESETENKKKIAPKKVRTEKKELTGVDQKKENLVKKPEVKKPKIIRSEVEDFKMWLSTLEVGVTPSVHINGSEYDTCVMTVDFGVPLEPVPLTPEQSSELVTRLRNATKFIMNNDVKVGVMNDASNGIWWTTATL